MHDFFNSLKTTKAGRSRCTSQIHWEIVAKAFLAMKHGDKGKKKPAKKPRGTFTKNETKKQRIVQGISTMQGVVTLDQTQATSSRLVVDSPLAGDGSIGRISLLNEDLIGLFCQGTMTTGFITTAFLNILSKNYYRQGGTMQP
jgi:hypothetical protein